MICQNHILRTFLLGPILGAILLAVIVAGCAGDAGHGDGRDSDRSTASQGISGGEDENSGGEHGGGREGSGEHGSGGEGGGRESSEADMSSPIIPLGQSWNGLLGGLAVSMQYDAATRTVHEDHVAKSLVVVIYHLWNEYYRPRIAKAVSAEPNQVECALLGDIRRVRNLIIHKNSEVPNGF